MVDELGAKVRQRADEVRRSHRLPSVILGVGQSGKTLCVEGVGLAEVDGGRVAAPETPYRIGSITKTFTSAVMLLLAERGELDLDEPVERYLPGTTIGRARLRQLLSHCGGLQREAPLDMWATMRGPTGPELLASLAAAEQIDRPGKRWHYSNLGYAVLGQVAERVTGQPCQMLIDRELLLPLGLTSTTWRTPESAAVGYRLDPYQEQVHIEPDMQQEAIGVGGQLWSTAEDLLIWGDALLGGAPEVLPAEVIDAMHTVQVLVDRRRWTSGWGLGLILERAEDRILSGHTGAMPGFLAALSMDRSSRTVAVAMTNVTRGVPISQVAADVLIETPAPTEQDDEPSGLAARCPDELEGALGRWWSEAEETIFTWQADGLHACLASDPDATGSKFVRDGVDHYRAVAGRLLGERLRLVRDSDGQVVSLDWATYPFARSPR